MGTITALNTKTGEISVLEAIQTETAQLATSHNALTDRTLSNQHPSGSISHDGSNVEQVLTTAVNDIANLQSNTTTLQGDVSTLQNDVVDVIGKFIQYDLTGTLEGGVLTFEPNAGETVTLENNKYYEFDLIFEAVGTVNPNTTMLISDGTNTYTIQSAMGEGTFANLAQIMTYNEQTGFRWIFEGTVGVVDTIRTITISSAIVNPKNLSINCLTKISNDEMLNAEIDGLLDGVALANNDIFICSDDNGYSIGHIYKFGIDETDPDNPVYSWTDTHGA